MNLDSELMNNNSSNTSIDDEMDITMDDVGGFSDVEDSDSSLVNKEDLDINVVFEFDYEESNFFIGMGYKEGQKFNINEIIPQNILSHIFYYTIKMFRNSEGIKYKTWDQMNLNRKSIQIVCKKWDQILKGSCKSLSLTQYNIQSIVENLNSFYNLRDIEVIGGEFPDELAEELSKIIEMNHPTLESIDISMTNLIGEPHIKLITESITKSKNTVIKLINFESNQIGDIGIKLLTESLDSLPNLSTLDLQACESLNGLEDIGRLVANNTSIKNLNWSYNQSDYSSVIALSDGLRGNISLTKISLRGCGLDGWGALSLGDTMKINKTIKILDISENDFGDAGSKNLSRNLSLNNSLEHLDISCNAITSEGLSSILDTMTTNKTLTYLDLSKNLIESNSIIPMLSECLKSNKSIQTLKLSQCTLSDSHIEFISNGLLFNQTLTHLDISRNNIYSIVPFISIITNNNTLKTLNLSKHKIKENDLYSLLLYLLKIPYLELVDVFPPTDLQQAKQQEQMFNNIIREVKHNLYNINLNSFTPINSNLKSKISKLLKIYRKSEKISI